MRSALLLLLMLAAPAGAQPAPEAALCEPFANATASLEGWAGDWLYARDGVDGVVYHGCLRLAANGRGVNRVEYRIGRATLRLEFAVEAQPQPDGSIRFEGRDPVRWHVREAPQNYSPDHFTCRAADATLACEHEDLAGAVDPPFTLRRR